MKAELVRIEESEAYGTFGVLKIDGEIFCVTLEPPDNDNMRRKSCIPVGEYECARYTSQRFGVTFTVRDIPGRTGILFHAGNTKADTSGCIILAEKFGKLKLGENQRAVINSGVTFKAFLDKLGDINVFKLSIKDYSD